MTEMQNSGLQGVIQLLVLISKKLAESCWQYYWRLIESSTGSAVGINGESAGACRPSWHILIWAKMSNPHVLNIYWFYPQHLSWRRTAINPLCCLKHLEALELENIWNAKSHELLLGYPALSYAICLTLGIKRCGCRKFCSIFTNIKIPGSLAAFYP